MNVTRVDAIVRELLDLSFKAISKPVAAGPRAFEIAAMPASRTDPQQLLFGVPDSWPGFDNRFIDICRWQFIHEREP
jgi:hypothetical protein